MERIKNLNRYQKAILLLMLAMTLIFTVVYIQASSRVGYNYKGAIFVPRQEDRSTVYSGKLHGEQAHFTVSNQRVTFQHGDQTYGPYIAVKDATALPKDDNADAMTGVELRKGDEIVFRGGLLKLDDIFMLYSEDGDIHDIRVSYIDSLGIERNEEGQIIDTLEPSASTVLELMHDPELTHKGEWVSWFFAVFLCIINALYILFVDELFRFTQAFRIQDANYAEPSDWEIATRYLSWTVLTIGALALFIMGLQ